MKAILQFPKLGKFSRGRVRNFPFSAEHGRNIHHGIEYPLNTPAEVAAFNAIAEKVQGDDSQDYRISTRIIEDGAAVVADAGGISREEAELMVKALDDLRAENAALKAAVQPPTAVADEAAEEPVKEATHHKKKGKAK